MVHGTMTRKKSTCFQDRCRFFQIYSTWGCVNLQIEIYGLREQIKFPIRIAIGKDVPGGLLYVAIWAPRLILSQALLSFKEFEQKIVND